MALKAEVQHLTAPGSTGSQAYNLTSGFGTPKAIIAFWTEQTADGAASHARFSGGFATYRSSTVAQFCQSFSSVDASGTGTVSQRFSSTALAILLDEGTTTIDGEVDLVSFGSDQFTLDWVNLPATASTILTVLVLGGDSITDALAHSIALATTDPIDLDVASGFGQPDVQIYVATGNDNLRGIGSSTAGGGFMLGAMVKDVGSRVTAFMEDDGPTNMVVGLWQKAAAILTMNGDTGAADGETTVAASSGWPTDGVEYDHNGAVGGTQTIAVLSLKGTFEANISARTTPTSAPTVNSDWDVGFTPKVALLWGTNITPAAGAAGVDTTSADLGQLWVGVTDGTTEGVRGFSEEDSAANSDTYSYYTNAKAVRINDADDGSVLLEADASFVGNALRLAYNDTFATSLEINALVLGSNDPQTLTHTAVLDSTPAIITGATLVKKITHTAVLDSVPNIPTGAKFDRKLTHTAALDSTPAIVSGTALRRSLTQVAVLDASPSLIAGGSLQTDSGQSLEVLSTLDSTPAIVSGSSLRKSLTHTGVLDSVPNIPTGGHLEFIQTLTAGTTLDSTPTIPVGGKLNRGLTVAALLDSTPAVIAGTAIRRLLNGSTTLDSTPAIITTGKLNRSLTVGAALDSSPSIFTGGIIRIPLVLDVLATLASSPSIFSGGKIVVLLFTPITDSGGLVFTPDSDSGGLTLSGAALSEGLTLSPESDSEDLSLSAVVDSDGLVFDPLE